MSVSPISSLPVELVQIIVNQVPDWKGRAYLSLVCKLFNAAVVKYAQDHSIEYNEAKLKAEKEFATRRLKDRIDEFHKHCGQRPQLQMQKTPLTKKEVLSSEFEAFISESTHKVVWSEFLFNSSQSGTLFDDLESLETTV